MVDPPSPALPVVAAPGQPLTPPSSATGLVDLAPREATALFSPPPPVAAEEPGGDEHSAPPALLNEEEVIVEEQFFEMPPAPEPVSPLAPITQPIQLSPPPGDLPMARSTPSAPGVLPRLDVSLADQDSGAASMPMLSEGGSQPGRTRLVLPLPGTENPGNAPSDFLHPARPATVIPPVPVPLIPPPMVAAAGEAPEIFPENRQGVPEETHPGDGEDVGIATTEGADFSGSYGLEPATGENDAWMVGEDPLDSADAEATSQTPDADLYRSIPIPPASEPRSLDDLEGGTEWEDLEEGNPLLESGFDPYADSFDGEAWTDEGADRDHGVPRIGAEVEEEPGRDELVAAAPEEEAINLAAHLPRHETDMVSIGAAEGSFPVPPADDTEDVPGNPLHEGSFGRLFAQQAPPEHRVPGPLGGEYEEAPAASSASLRDSEEGDILDELFSSSATRAPGEPRRLSKTAILLISTFVGVVIFTIIAVVVAVNVFGGGWSISGSDQGGEEPPLASGGDDTQVVKPVGASLPPTIQDPGIGDAPAVIDQPAVSRGAEGAGGAVSGPGTGVPSDPPAVAFDEKVQRAVNGNSGASVIGSPSLDLVDRPVTDFSPVSPSFPGGNGAPGTAENEGGGPASSEPVAAVGNAADAAEPEARSVDPAMKADPNYHPPESFAAPTAEDGPLGKTRDLIDAFLRAPDWETRVKYAYHGDSLQPAIADYYQKWPYRPFPRYSLQLYQLETDTSLGGPYWVFIVSTSDTEEGFPLIVRTENGLLKVDWEIFAEFYDQHFLRFRDGLMPPPATFRVIIERFSDYFGSDKEAFTDLKDHLVYQVNPPYGDLNEFSEYVFVKKDTEIAKKLEGLVRLGDEPLAVVVTIDQKAFEHGVKHFVVTDLITEGWFR